jgi:hypothetical protein
MCGEAMNKAREERERKAGDPFFAEGEPTEIEGPLARIQVSLNVVGFRLPQNALGLVFFFHRPFFSFLLPPLLLCLIHPHPFSIPSSVAIK